MKLAKALLCGRRYKLVAVGTAIFLVCHIYYTLNNRSWSWYLHTSQGSVACRTPADEMRDLIAITKDTHGILVSLNLTHFPIYGSLFGAHRYENPLPWDTDVDLFLREEELNKINEEAFVSKFKSKGIEIFYRPWFGAYRITRGRARGDLMIFKNYSGTMNRIGIESYVFYQNYRKHHIFPSRFIEGALPKVNFCGIEMPVPKGGLEFQKYHYQGDWWLEKKPFGCDGTASKP